MVKNPCWARTLPCPLQALQDSGAAPFLEPIPLHASHCTDEGTRILVLLPLKACVNEISILYRRSAPRPD